jgi:hypothetical protein
MDVGRWRSTIVVDGDETHIDRCGPMGGELAQPFADDVGSLTAGELADRLRHLTGG